MSCRNPRQFIRLRTVSAPMQISTECASLISTINELLKDTNGLLKYRFRYWWNNIQVSLFFHKENVIWDFVEIGTWILNMMEIEDGMGPVGLAGGD